MNEPQSDSERDEREPPREGDPPAKRAPQRERREGVREPREDVERETPRPGGPGDARP